MSVVTPGTCPDVELLTALVDAELDRGVRDEVEDHVASCRDCASAVAAERRIKSALAGLRDPAPSSDLSALLRAIPSSDGLTEAPSEPTPVRKLPTYFAAAASVVVLMVGAFTFIGASSGTGPSPTSPNRTTAIVPAADRLTQEHAVTSVQGGLGGPAMVPVSFATAAAR